MRRTRLLLATAIAGLALGRTAAVALARPGTETGPSSSQSPYMVRSEPGIGTTSILTVGDSVGGYRMVGIPDGLGAYDNGDGTFTTPFLGDGVYLLDMQVHAASSDPELDEGGQYMELHIPPGRRF